MTGVGLAAILAGRYASGRNWPRIGVPAEVAAQEVGPVRTLMTVEVPTEAGSQAIKDGRMNKVLESLLNDIRPEAVYFALRSGHRGMYIVFDLDDVARLPQIAEPLFMEFQAKVEFAPVMNREDLATGLGRLGV
jgi:hypothetical protein